MKNINKMICTPMIVAALLPQIALGAVTKGDINPAISYEIGGYSKQPSRKNRNLPVKAGIEWDNNLMCGNFDTSLSVTNILNGVTSDLKKLGDDLISSATGLVSNSLWIELARTDPYLYELMQQGKLEALELFSASVASCQEMTNDVINGGGHEDWVKISGYEDWLQESKSGSKDAVLTADTIEKNKGDNGVTWVNGEKQGGQGQKAIQVERDTIRAGYNLLARRTANDTSPIGSSDSSPAYSAYWKTPKEAEDWITDIVGETDIRTCKNCERAKTKAGRGVYAYLEESQHLTSVKIQSLLESNQTNYTREQLLSVSAPGLPVTQQVLEALKQENIYQSVMTERLAEEVAVNNLVERLIAARQLLIAGQREAYISDNREASKLIEMKVALLEGEMNLIRQDMELRKATRESVALTLLNRQNARVRPSTVPSNSESNSKDALQKITGRK